jgi:hypothetical protein
MARKIYIIGVLFVIFSLAGSWGFLVHRTVNQLAIYQLPKGMRPFFHNNMKYLVEQSVRPDQRRNADSAEAPRHFIDLEAFGDSAAWKMPFNWEDAIRIYSKDSLLKYGFVPYHIVWMKSKLTEAFRQRNKDSILFYAADLAHYIGDANVPLHTTLNYDGQLTNQKGLHSLWESMIPEIELQQYTLHSGHSATYLDDPSRTIWEGIRKAHLMLGDVFAQEIETTKAFPDSTKYRVQMRRGREVRSYTSEFAKAFQQRLGNTINQQLLHSANMIADFWYTAWVDAGKPELTAISGQPFTKENKKALKAERKAYEGNKLLEKGLLLAKKQTTGESQ